MTEFGIVAITRKRMREPLARLTTHACATCDGTGRRLRRKRVALEILRRVEREAGANPGRALAGHAPRRRVAEWLNDHARRRCAQALARRGAARVRFEAGAKLAREAIDVRPV